ncbi:MAG: MBL fold metallo-hydrolase [Candidatus Saccharimonadales bacterium]|nr:MBL fold metallo-hydrolase [Candidatus Saccharimonadales bacterium]
MWQIGDVKIYSVLELEDAGSVIQDAIKQASPEVAKKMEWLQPYFIDDNGKLLSVTQSFLIDNGDEVTLVDACVGDGKKFDDLPEWSNLSTKYLENLDICGYKPEDIDKVVFTHLHFDHVGWSTVRKDGKLHPTFPNAEYICNKTEYEYWLNKPSQELKDDLDAFNTAILPLSGLVRTVSPKEEVAKGVSLTPTYGHTPGHVCILVQSGDNSALITGDTFHHPCQITHPEWLSFDTDEKAALDTKKNLIDKYSDTETLIIGSHFAQPSAGYIKKHEDSYIFEAKE